VAGGELTRKNGGFGRFKNIKTYRRDRRVAEKKYFRIMMYSKEFTTDKKTGYSRMNTDMNAGTYNNINK